APIKSLFAFSAAASNQRYFSNIDGRNRRPARKNFSRGAGSGDQFSLCDPGGRRTGLVAGLSDLSLGRRSPALVGLAVGGRLVIIRRPPLVGLASLSLRDGGHSGERLWILQRVRPRRQQR